ncbi:MAG: hypothetical protein ACRD1T_17505 [Acidimicrobiia bacterium]
MKPALRVVLLVLASSAVLATVPVLAFWGYLPGFYSRDGSWTIIQFLWGLVPCCIAILVFQTAMRPRHRSRLRAGLLGGIFLAAAMTIPSLVFVTVPLTLATIAIAAAISRRGSGLGVFGPGAMALGGIPAYLVARQLTDSLSLPLNLFVGFIVAFSFPMLPMAAAVLLGSGHITPAPIQSAQHG